MRSWRSNYMNAQYDAITHFATYCHPKMHTSTHIFFLRSALRPHPPPRPPHCGGRGGGMGTDGRPRPGLQEMTEALAAIYTPPSTGERPPARPPGATAYMSPGMPRGGPTSLVERSARTVASWSPESAGPRAASRTHSYPYYPETDGARKALRRARPPCPSCPRRSRSACSA